MMNGHLILDTPIAVDFWNIRKCASANVFFLSHIHSDHTVGLTSSWSRPIYCSKVTGELLCHKVSISEDLIRPLELHNPTLIPLNPSHSEMVTVTAIEADHCPGAVMFLFQGNFGTILYTGDFRYTSEMFVDSPLNNVSVDILYLDNTYCDPLCVFDTREKEKENVFEIIKSYPEHDILLGMQSIGKPDLLIDIAKKFQEYIGVPSSMYKYLEILEVPNVFQIDSPEHECRLRVMPAYYISKKLFSKLTRPTIAILTTALYVGLEGTPYSNQNSIHVVPYSDHSSYMELEEFVKQVRPGRIIPIVGRGAKGPFNVSFAKRADMTCFDLFLSEKHQEICTNPADVEMRKARSVVQSNAVLTTSKRRKRSLGMTVTKSVASRGVVFESSPQKSTNKSNVRENVVQNADNPSNPSGSTVIEAVYPDTTKLKKTCSPRKIPLRPVEETTHICVQKSCTPGKPTHMPNSNNESGSLASRPNLNPDCSGTNTLNTSRTDLENVNDGRPKNHPDLSPLHNGVESQRDHDSQEKIPGNSANVQESVKNSKGDEKFGKDSSSTTSSGLSSVYSIQPGFPIVKSNDHVSVQPLMSVKKRKLPPFFDEEFHPVYKRRLTDFWNSETRQIGTSSKEISLAGNVCVGEPPQSREADLEGENEVTTDITSVTSLSMACRPALSFLSKTSRSQKSVFTSLISDYFGRFDGPGWTFMSCQKVFSDFSKKQRLRYTEKAQLSEHDGQGVFCLDNSDPPH